MTELGYVMALSECNSSWCQVGKSRNKELMEFYLGVIEVGTE